LGISFGSINTGLPKDIVKQIMEAEKIPVKKMEERKGKIENKKQLVGELNKLMGDLKGKILQNGNARSLKELKVDTNSELVGVTVDKNIANPANYQFEVVQLAQKTSAMSAGVPDKDETYIGVGYITYRTPDGTEKEVFVGADDASLTGIAKLINKDSDNGMHATVVNDGSGSDAPWRLLISLDNVGDDNKAEFPYFYFVDGEYDLYLEKERPAQDAKIKVDGFEIEVPENKVKDVIPGVTIDLKKAKPGEEFGINIGTTKRPLPARLEIL
jgi:flagellar hook-associated protein 2